MIDEEYGIILEPTQLEKAETIDDIILLLSE
jgi:acyl carrier protein